MVAGSARNQTLDAIRGIAILMVVIHHSILPPFTFSHNIPGTSLYLLKAVLLIIARGGWTGVDLFFVLSGFLVSGLLFKEYKQKKHINIGRFLIRRGFKIYPMLYVFIVFTFFLELFYHRFTHKNLLLYNNKHGYLYDIAFTTNYLGGRWIHLWSLDVEEHFYLLLTLYFYILVRNKWVNYKTIIGTSVFLFIFAFTARATGFVYPSGDTFLESYTQTHIRLDALFCGVVISYIYHNYPEKLNPIYRHKILLTLISVGYLLTNFIFNRYQTNFIPILSLGLNPVCYGIILIIALHCDFKWLKNIVLIRLGRISYALYIWHFFVNKLFEINFPPLSSSPIYWLDYLITYISASIIIAWITTTLIENPLLKIRDRYFPSISPAPAIKSNRLIN